MTLLKSLKLSDQTRSKSIAAPEVRRREKLLINIERQINAAKAELKGELYTFEQMKQVTDPETGERTRQPVSVPVRPWWWKDMAGTYFTIIKYGNKKLELAKGKYSIEVGEQKNIATVLTQVMEAVKTGELDELINSAAYFGSKGDPSKKVAK